MKQISFNKLLNYLLFLSTFALFSYTDAVYVSKGINSNIWISLKYITMLLGVGFGALQILFRVKYNNTKRVELTFKKETFKILVVVVVFLFLSLIYQLISGNITSNMYSELIKLILPIIYAFCILNVFNFDDIYNCMIAVLIFAILGYILEIGINNFTWANIKQISYSTSYSPFESHYAAGTAIATCAFFMYYRKNPIFKYISLVFAIFTFKRLAIIFALIFLILPKFVNVNRKVSPKWSWIIKILFVVATIIYYHMLLPDFSDTFQKIFNDSAARFTMGRSIYLDRIINGNFHSYGLGSTTVFIGKSIEMDFIKILIEISIVGLIVFIWNYWDICNNHLYCMVYMLFIFINLLTSHSLTNVFSWILVYIIIGSIVYKNDNEAHVKYKYRHRKVKPMQI